MQLAKLDPRRISVREVVLAPTWWDSRAVLPDLIEFVSLARIVPGTPGVAIDGETLVLINGLSYVRAARDAEPPLEEIVCKIDADEAACRDFGLEPLKVSDLLAADPPDRIREEVQMLHFQSAVDQSKRRVAESVIKNFFTEMATTTGHGGNYRSLGDFDWNENGNRLVWRWVRSIEEGRHQILLVEALKSIGSSVCPLRSWNGLTFDFDLPEVGEFQNT